MQLHHQTLAISPIDQGLDTRSFFVVSLARGSSPVKVEKKVDEGFQPRFSSPSRNHIPPSTPPAY